MTSQRLKTKLAMEEKKKEKKPTIVYYNFPLLARLLLFSARFSVSKS